MTITLTEYEPRRLSPAALPQAAGESLWRNYSGQVAVEFPSPKTGGQWQLTALGWVGHIPLTPEIILTLLPKVELQNLFGMLAYAYNLESFRFLAGDASCQSLGEFYERLATILARRVLERGRKGFYRAYLPRSERLPYVRGRLDAARLGQRPDRAQFHCHYETHTPDVAENRILAWTLWQIARHGGWERPQAMAAVRRAYRSLQGMVTLTPYTAADCAGRLYNRLNRDYRPMHALCRFFLEQSGPAHRVGERTVVPFLVDMARLYERFVAAWLQQHLPAGWRMRAQERLEIGPLRSFLDLVLYRGEEARYVLDTKYKDPEKGPVLADIYQAVAYAEARQCPEAILIYPAPLALDEMWGNIRVRSLTFSLAGDLDQAGQAFIKELFR